MVTSLQTIQIHFVQGQVQWIEYNFTDVYFQAFDQRYVIISPCVGSGRTGNKSFPGHKKTDAYMRLSASMC